MRCLRWFALAALVPALTMLVLTAGCGSDTKSKDKDVDNKDKGDKPSGELKAIKATKGNTLKGRVVLDGSKPDLDKLTKTLEEQIGKHLNKDFCLKVPDDKKDDILQQEWKIDDKTMGVAEVMVWVAPLSGFYFEVDAKDRDRNSETVTLDQPHCAYRPHVLTLFPSYNDGKGQKPTGQKFVVKNSATVPHNTEWKGGPKNQSENDNKTIAPGMSITMPQFKPDTEPITISCVIHPWMRAYARAFDHPFVAVTNSEGLFEIKDVPAGDLRVIAWHPAADYLTDRKGETITIKEGANTKDFKAKAK